ncbi:hypothetical protein ACHAQJ_008757 [Trichoderma viride]
MKPASILLLTAAGLASALPAQPFVPRSALQNAPIARSFLDRAIEAIGARDLVPLNANTAALPAADLPADKKGAALPAVTTTSAAAVAAKTTAAAANNAASVASVATSAAAVATDAAAVATDAATAAATTAAATTTAAGAIATDAAAAGNGTASAGNNGKGKGKGKGGAGNAAGKGKGKGQGQKQGNGNNNNDNAISVIITSALSQLGLDGVLDASKVNALSGGQQVQLLAQIISLQTMSDLKMVNSNDVVVVLNQGFKNSGLNVVINA